jgi:hypothetical protein
VSEPKASGPTGSSGQRSPLDPVLDVVLYAPVGLALTVGEELPKLAAKGRSQVTSQIAIARLVGQFAVAQGRRQAERWLSTAAPPTRSADGPAPEPTVVTGAPDAASPGHSAEATSDVGPLAPSAQEGSMEPPKSSASEPSPDGLGIPGYDSLSASQVVQRLTGLDRAELEAVRSYEQAHRGRRTILARIEQLQANSNSN